MDKPKVEHIKLRLEKGLSPLHSFTLGFSSIGVFVSLVTMLPYGLITGGPVVMIWGWIGHSVLAMMITAYMAEMCSAHPAVGSVYHWTAVYCPSPKWVSLSSYLCGWLNLLGNVAFGTALANSMASLVSACIALMTNGQ